MRKYRGTIFVRHNLWTADFYKGRRATEPFARCGNVGVAYDIIEMLEQLGFVVEIDDESGEDEP